MLCSKPVIAAVDGFAVAGGLELACMCDLRIVEESAIMGVFCRRFGEICWHLTALVFLVVVTFFQHVFTVENMFF